MSTKLLRRKRFHISETTTLNVVLTTLTGDEISGRLREISYTGCSIEMKISPELKLLQKDQILNLGKISSDTMEWGFGRSVIKFIKETEQLHIIGIMFVDVHAPVDGLLSKYISVDLDSTPVMTDLELDSDNASLADFLGKKDLSKDIFSKAKKYHYYHSSLKKNDRWGYWIARQPSKGVRVNLKMQRPDGRNDFILMASNDYLGLSSHPEVVDAAKAALDKYGFGATGSPVTCGQTEAHEKLQETLSRIFRTESCLLFNSGYAANLGTISSLVGVNDLVVADILAHASITDGMQQSQGVKRFHKHNDVEHLEKVLKRSRGECDGALIVVEGIFSMDGDTAPLREIYNLSRKYDARIMLDEAHSFGVLGNNGIGLVEEENLLGSIDVMMGTFSKICGTIGGFICAPREVVDWLNVSARSVFFSVALPPSTVAATQKSLEIFQENKFLLERLRANINFFVEGLRKLGFDFPHDHRSAIVPVVIGDDIKLGKMYKMLFDAGVYTIPVVYPAVSKNSSRFRFTVSALHSTSDLDYVLLVIKRCIETLGIVPNRESQDESA